MSANVQTQLNNSIPTTNGIATNGFTVKGTALITTNLTVNSNLFVGGKIQATNITASRALVSDSGANITNSSVTSTELGYVSGVTSAIQPQITNRVLISGGYSIGQTNENTRLKGDVFIPDLTDNRVLVSDGGVLSVAPITQTELISLTGITGNIQTNLNNKLDTTNGIATNSFTIKGNLTTISNATVNSNLFVGGSVTATNLTASRALVSDASKGITNSAVTTTELGRLSGVTGGIQTNIDARLQALSGIATNLTVKSNLTSLGGANFNSATFTNGVTNLTHSYTYGTNYLATLFFGDLSPATNGSLGLIQFHGLNSDSVTRTYASLETTIDTHIAGSENGRLDIKLLQGGLTNVAAKFNSNSVTFNTNVVINGTAQFPNAGAVAGYVLTATGTNGQTIFAPVGTLPGSLIVSAAIGNGTTDDTATIQSELDSMTNGGTLFFLEGTYKLTAPLLVTNPHTVVSGVGMGTSFKSYTTSGNIFHFAATTDPTTDPTFDSVGIKDCQIISASNRTDGAAIYMRMVHRPMIFNIRIGQQTVTTNEVTPPQYIYDGIILDGQDEGSFEHLQVNFKHEGMSVHALPDGDWPDLWSFSCSYDGFLFDFHFWGDSSSGSSALVLNTNTGGFQLEAGNLAQAETGIKIKGAIRELNLGNCYIDTITGNGIDGTDGTINTLMWRSGWAAGCGGDGLYLTDGGGDVQLVGVHMYNNTGANIRLTTNSFSNLLLSGNVLRDTPTIIDNNTSTRGNITGNTMFSLLCTNGYGNFEVVGNASSATNTIITNSVPHYPLASNPTNTNAIVKWVAWKIDGDTNDYRMPLYR